MEKIARILQKGIVLVKRKEVKRYGSDMEW